MRIRYAGRMWNVRLEDDGTLDTVISVSPDAKKGDLATPEVIKQTHVDTGGIDLAYAKACGAAGCQCGVPMNRLHKVVCRDFYFPSQEVRFDGEYAAQYRRPNGEMTMRGLRILGKEAAEVYTVADELEQMLCPGIL